MRAIEKMVAVSACLSSDRETRRWYKDGGQSCLVLTARGRLLEPHPTFGPTEYRLLALRTSRREADIYARRTASSTYERSSHENRERGFGSDLQLGRCMRHRRTRSTTNCTRD